MKCRVGDQVYCGDNFMQILNITWAVLSISLMRVFRGVFHHPFRKYVNIVLSQVLCRSVGVILSFSMDSRCKGSNLTKEVRKEIRERVKIVSGPCQRCVTCKLGAPLCLFGQPIKIVGIFDCHCRVYISGDHRFKYRRKRAGIASRESSFLQRSIFTLFGVLPMLC